MRRPQMGRVGTNVVANSIGLVVQSIASLLFTAVYFRLLGPSAFGLVSFCQVLLLLAATFADLGVGRTIVREMARARGASTGADALRNVLFTLQIVHVFVAVALGVAIVVFAPVISRYWLQAGPDGSGDASSIVAMVGLLLVLSLPTASSAAAIIGLQKHALRNFIGVTFSLARGVVTVLALLYLEADVVVYMVAQIGVSCLEVLVTTFLAWRLFPSSHANRPLFKVDVLQRSWRFAMSDGVALILGVFIMNADRIILSRMLPLELFGAYSLVVTLSTALLRFPAPLTTAYFPHFVDLFSRGSTEQLKSEYFQATSILSAFIIPSGVVLATFSCTVVWVVGGARLENSPEIATVLSIHAIGTIVNGLTHFPHTLQLSAGRPDLALIGNVIWLFLFPAALFSLVNNFGMVGASVAWLGMASLSFLPMAYFGQRVAQVGGLGAWLVRIVLGPALAVVTISETAKNLVQVETGMASLIVPALALGVSTIAVVIVTPETRAVVMRYCKSWL